MITVNPVKITTIKPISFGTNNNNNNSRVGLMNLDKNSNNKINFEKDLYITQKAHSKRKLYTFTVYGLIKNII